MDGPPLASLSLTHVHYDAQDPLAHLCAYLALVPQALMIAYVSLIWSTREIEILLMFAGQLACEALNWLLKRYIKEERPTQMVGKGYGMPSSHAQFVAYFSTFLALFVLLRHSPYGNIHSSTTHLPTPLWQRVILALLLLTGAGAVAQSRIYLNYHTPKQVLVGSAVGVGCALAWFIVTSIARHFGVVDMVLDLPPVKWFRFRDLVVSETLEDAGWERWEKSRLRRAQLNAKKDK